MLTGETIKQAGVEALDAASFTINGLLVAPAELRLSGNAGEALLEPKVMAVLAALAERPGQTWKREDLIDRVWGGNGGDESLTRAIYMLRKSLEPFIGENTLITVPRLGYRLNAHIERAAPTGGGPEADPFSVAVLPITDQSGADATPRLADGLTRDLTSLLSRVPRLRVAPVSSAAHHAASEDDNSAIARKLNVRFLAKGSLVRFDEEIRIRIELIDCLEGEMLWSQKYDARLDRFYEVQEEAVIGIATAIAAKIKVPHRHISRRAKSFIISTYERVQEAEALRYNYSRGNADAILALLGEALSGDPDDVNVTAALAVQLSQHVVSRWAEDPDAARQRADALIGRAVAESPQDPEILAAAGIVAAMFHRPDEAIDFLERSLAYNPNEAHALAVLGWQRSLRYADPNGVRLIAIAEERAPHHPRFGLWATYCATAHLFLLDYEAGLAAARKAVARTPNYYQPILHCAWAHAGLGENVAALDAIEKAQAIESGVLTHYIDEMLKWSANSPNREECHRILARLEALSRGD